MSGRMLIALYFLAALAFGLFTQLRQPFATVNFVTVAGALGTAAGALGTALSLFLMAALIPALIWLIGRFRPQDARPSYDRAALTLWAAFGVALAYLMEAGNRFDLSQKINAELGQIDLAGRDRDDFIRNAKRSCADAHKQSQLNRQAGVTETQIAAYCDCYANAMIKVITVEDMRYIAMNNKPSPKFQERIDRLSPECTRVAFGR